MTSSKTIKPHIERPVRTARSSFKMIKAAAAILIFGLAVTLLTKRMAWFLNVPGHFGDRYWTLRDFRESIYYPVVALLDGVNPYDSNAYSEQYPVDHFPLYSPLIMVVHLPIAMFSAEAAPFVYYVFTLGLTFLLAIILLRFVGTDFGVARVFGLAALILMSRPGHQNLLNGQCTMEVVLASFVAIHYSRRQPWCAGIALGLATMKPTFGVPLALLMLCRRDYQSVIIGAVVGGVGALIPIVTLLLSGHDLATIINAVTENLKAHGSNKYTNLTTTYSRIDIVFVISRWTGWIPPLWGQAALSISVLLLGGFSARQSAHPDRGESLWGFLACFTVLLFFYHQSYDLLMLTFPLLTVAVAKRHPWSSISPARRWSIVFFLSVPLINYAATASVVSRLALSPGGLWWTVITATNGTIVASMFALCVYRVLVARPPSQIASELIK